MATSTGSTGRSRVYLTWSLRYGLTNQLYSHVNGLALALLLGVDGAILPPAVCRATFNTTLEHLADEALWSPQPLGTLLDVRKMQAHWRKRHNIDLQEATKFTMTSEGTKYPRPLLTSARPAGELHDCTVLPINVPEFSTITNAAAAARQQLEAARAKDAAAGCFILRTESLFRGFFSNSTGGLQATASRGVFYAHRVVELADRVAERIGGRFNAMHLRFEPDMGLNPQELLPVMVGHMRELGYNASILLYAASGLLSYNDTSSLQTYTKVLHNDGVCSKVVVKEDYLAANEVEGLHSEQKAMVDLLVLAHADKFVGTKRSAFSYMARELRQLDGHSPSTSILHPPRYGGYWQDGVMEISGKTE
jgi:hypothetical protein